MYVWIEKYVCIDRKFHCRILHVKDTKEHSIILQHKFMVLTGWIKRISFVSLGKMSFDCSILN